MPFLVCVWPAWVMVLKSPTAYIRLPHLTSCLTFWVPFPLADASWGVPFAGVVDTPPVALAAPAVAAPAVAAPAGVAAAYQADPAASATAITPARPGSRRTLRERIISSCDESGEAYAKPSHSPASAPGASPQTASPAAGYMLDAVTPSADDIAAIRAQALSGVGQEADPGVAVDSVAHVGVEPVAAGDPQARAGDQHVISVRPGRAVHGFAARGFHRSAARVE